MIRGANSTFGAKTSVAENVTTGFEDNWFHHGGELELLRNCTGWYEPGYNGRLNPRTTLLAGIVLSKPER